MRKQDGCEPWDRVEGAPRAPPVSPKAVNASEEFLGQRDDDARRASHVAESVLVLVLGHLADEFGAVGAQASDSVVDASDCKHDAPETQRVWRCDRWFDLDQFWIAKLRQLKLPVPIWGPHHNDVDLDTFEPVDAVHPRALDRRLAFDRHAPRGEKSDSGCKVVDDDADVIQSLDRHAPNIAEAVRGAHQDREWDAVGVDHKMGDGFVRRTKARKQNFSWTICRIPVRPFDYMVKA